LSSELPFSCDTAGPATVRRWLDAALRAALPADDAHRWLISDALIIATELVTNAVHAGCSRARMRWALEPGCLQLSVFDNAPGWPVVQNPGPTETHGRGLRIIDAIADARGTRLVDGGKLAWAALRLPTASDDSA
jgi:two-component sensor histidine kinase